MYIFETLRTIFVKATNQEVCPLDKKLKICHTYQILGFVIFDYLATNIYSDVSVKYLSKYLIKKFVI